MMKFYGKTILQFIKNCLIIGLLFLLIFSFVSTIGETKAQTYIQTSTTESIDNTENKDNSDLLKEMPEESNETNDQNKVIFVN